MNDSSDMRTALVCGAGGFIGHHLVGYLKEKGYWVRGVDIKNPEYEASAADDFPLLDLRREENCEAALTRDEGGTFDEVYQLAADMGGMGFIQSAECEVIHNSTLINVNMSNCAIRRKQVARYFFSSSACVYRDQDVGENELAESDAYPAHPDNEYGWEKLYAERMAMTYGRHSPTEVRLARFQNCYGPLGTWKGGREKAPAAMCRKVAEAGDGDALKVWGDGTAIRAFTYVDDLVDGIYRLMHSDLEDGVNIGRQEYVTVDELAALTMEIAGKKLRIEHVNGPVGVQARYFTDDRIRSTGWTPGISLREGLSRTYPWILEQVEEARD